MITHAFRAAFALTFGIVTFVPVAWAQNPPDSACGGKSVDEWLLGHWGASDKTRIDFRRSGDKILWRYKRDAGVMTQRWGEKQPAEGEGDVHSVKGCAIQLRGKYTSYAGSVAGKAVGAVMNYDLTFDGQRRLTGTGFGWGKEPFEIGFHKD